MMSEEEKERLLAKERMRYRKRKAEGKISRLPDVPRTGLALAKQQDTQRAYKAGQRHKLKSTSTAATTFKAESKSKLCQGEALVATPGLHQDRNRAALYTYKWSDDKFAFLGYPKSVIVIVSCKKKIFWWQY